MGHSLPFVVSDQTLRVTNLRSYQDDGCDVYWDWAFMFQDQ
jgi:hypothetical protein